MKACRHETPQEVAECVAREIERLVQSDKPQINLGLATGSTVLPLYAVLRRTLSKVDLSRVHTFNLDEYLGLSEQHDQSYHYYMRVNLFDALNFPAERTHFPREGEDYDALIAKHGGLDLLLLGIGVNGHIGFNEPGSSGNSRTRVVELEESTRRANARFFANMDEVPRQAVTMGIATILDARTIHLLATGPTKADCVGRAFSYKEPNEDLPASFLLKHKGATWHVDKEAAAQLK